MTIVNNIKYQLIRIIESMPKLNLLIYNNINFFKIFLPHEKDYYGLKLLLKNKINNSIIDVGGNLGISSMGFRKLGFDNKIYIFEPNKFIFKNYIKSKLLKNYQNIYAFNYALGNKNDKKDFFYPYYKKKCIHYFCSFDREYLKNSIKITFKNKQIQILKDPISIKKYDDLKIKCIPKFIKIDVEGYDLEVILGMNKTINKYKPIILVEFNKNNFFQIKKKLKQYKPWVYFYKYNKFKLFNRKMVDNEIARTNKLNLMSIRNVFFIPKLNKWI